MVNFYKLLVRPLFFRLQPEVAHELVMKMLSLGSSVFGGVVPAPGGKEVECFGLKFPNAIGLAAGMDKDGTALPIWPLLGFGFVEIGTVTAKVQPGNPKPRLFRLPKQKALINRMGFNNYGAEAMARRLAAWKRSGKWPKVPVGINLGKSKVTPLDEAARDYAESFRQLREFGDYFVVNVSSPNTPGLRELQAAGHLREILRALARENVEERPVLVKIAPDLEDADIAEVVECGEEEGVAGWIATNTTLDHSAVPAEKDQQGGLSGEIMRAKATQVLRRVVELARTPVIGVGGVTDGVSAREKLDMGASLVQLYTSLIYEGPWLPRRIARELSV